MAKTDFTFVGSPHDPLSISGSDPHTGSVDDGSGARLAAWYKIEPGYFLTSSALGNTNRGPGDKHIYKLFEASGGSKDRNSVQRHLSTNGTDGYSATYQPAISASMIGQGYLDGDDQYFMVGDFASNQGINLQNSSVYADRDLDADTVASDAKNWRSGWISGSHDPDSISTAIDQASWEGYTLFGVMKQANNNTANNYTLCYLHGAEREDGIVGQSNNASFSIGIKKHSSVNSVGAHQGLLMGWCDVGDNAAAELYSDDANYSQNWHIVTGWASRSPGPVASIGTEIKLYANGILAGETWMEPSHVDTPIITGAHRYTRIGGSYNSATAGYISSCDMTDATNPASAALQGFAECFTFEDALSHQRRQQMERYLADKNGIEMSSSTYLSSMEGGPEGTAQVHAALGSALTGIGTYARAYYQAATSSSDFLIQHETCGGGFLKSTADGGNFYKVQSESATSLRLHVRAESLNDSKHAGSQVALVSKATSPFGHAIDNIKGYALKFGTLKDDADQGDTPKFRLSLRNGAEYLDGKTSSGCTDIDLSSSILGETMAVDTWYTMRLDVVPSGHSYDRIRAYASTDGGSTFHELSASGATALDQGEFPASQDINRDSEKYRYWADDHKFNANRVPIPNGVHNGYYVTLSSSTGHTIGTKYYVDGFTAKLDTV
jgi:hypothetical protein